MNSDHQPTMEQAALVLTHAQKCYLSKQKISQVQYLRAIVEKILGTSKVSDEF